MLSGEIFLKKMAYLLAFQPLYMYLSKREWTDVSFNKFLKQEQR